MDVLFYGAMNRPENWKSIIWFIENVWKKKDFQNARLIIVGNKPPIQLLNYAPYKSGATIQTLCIKNDSGLSTNPVIIILSEA